MGRIKYFLVLLLCVLSLSAYKKNEKITIFMIGDSTMANKDISGGKMERGWGMMLKNFFTEDVIVDNHALNGRSSKSFISEGHWQKIVEKIKPGDYVFIQFGHNDEKDDPKRHTDPDDDTRSNSSADLVEGDTLVDTHGDYLLSPRNVARELDVPFVDANKITHDLEQGLGPDKSKKLHMWYLPNEVPSLPKGRQDNTHYNVYGAYVVAGLLADAVSDAVPELKQYRCKYDASVARDGSGLYFDLQTAVEHVPSGVKTTILVGEGKWKKPVAGKDKKIEYIMRQGASFIK